MLNNSVNNNNNFGISLENIRCENVLNDAIKQSEPNEYSCKCTLVIIVSFMILIGNIK